MNNYRRRKRVDWDEEIKKTERIKRKGFLISALSFAMACAFIFGIHKFTGSEFQLSRKFITAFIFCILLCAAFSISAYIRKKRNK